jgi:hypothetical protein
MVRELNEWENIKISKDQGKMAMAEGKKMYLKSKVVEATGLFNGRNHQCHVDAGSTAERTHL